MGAVGERRVQEAAPYCYESEMSDSAVETTGMLDRRTKRIAKSTAS